METVMTLEKDGGLCRVVVSVTDSGFSWSYHQDGLHQTDTIKISQLLMPRIQSQETHISRLIVQYASVVVPKKKQVILRCEENVFLGTYEECESVKMSIRNLLQSKEPHRPKRLLIFVNPKSGFGTAARDYDTIVKPLLARCGVDVDAIVTKGPEHADDVLMKYDLSTIDAVVSMGGDGSFAQVSNGLLRRTMNDAQVDIDDPEIPGLTPSVPFAVIPGGSGCAVSLKTTGTAMDIESAAIVIILGWTAPLDVIGSRHLGKFMGYGNLVISYGIASEVFFWLERIKWLGRHRYWFVLPRCWWTWTKFEVEIDYLPTPNHGHYFGYEPHDASSDKSITEGPWPGWKTLRCKASDIAVTDGRLREQGESTFSTKNYLRPKPSTGSCELTLIVGDSVWEMLKGYQFIIGFNKTPGRSVRRIEVTEFKIRILDNWVNSNVGHQMFVDGEPRKLSRGAAFEIKLQPGLLSAFTLNPDLMNTMEAALAQKID